MMKATVLLGSRNPEGQTARAAQAFVDGLTEAGAEVEQVFLPTLDIQRCRQCDERGWGLCLSEGRCVIEDNLAGIADRMRTADAVVFATPVYFGDLSESLRAFLDRVRRTTRHDNGKRGITDKPAVGICVAGGGGGGAPSCCMSLEKVLGHCGFALQDVIPVRRQNLETKLAVLWVTGQRFAAG